MNRLKSHGPRPLRRALCVAIAVASSTAAASRENGAPAPAVAGPWIDSQFWKRSTVDAKPVAPPPQGAVVVGNCDDSGAGSLRDAIDHAADGAAIDLTQLSCSIISLTSGPLAVAQQALTLRGPGAGRLTVSGNDSSQVLVHTGSGEFSIEGVAVAHGLAVGSYAKGGCLYSAGRLVIARAAVHDCAAVGTGDQSLASGGGAFGRYGLEATDAAIYGNSSRTTAAQFPQGAGGGVVSGGPIVLTRSYVGRNQADVCGGFAAPYGLQTRYTTIASNGATNTAAGCATSGLTAAAAIDIESTAIIDNTAGNFAALFLYGGAPPVPTMRLVNSTVSGNTGGAASNYGAIYTRYGILEIANSTIAFNSIADGQGAGIFAIRDEVHLDSSIIAQNTTYAGTSFEQPSDIYGFDATFLGSSSLVTYSRLNLPVDTIIADPNLLPLAYNGGRTKTHLPAPTSPAIDAGSNAFALTSDQRGPAYPRTRGGATDIGAVELDPDHIFGDGFDE